MTNNFVNRHPSAMGIGLHAMIDFNIRDLEMTLKSHPRSKVTLTKSAIRNIFCYQHLWPTGNGLAAQGDFHFCYLEMTPQRSSKVKVIADSESLLSSFY